MNKSIQSVFFLLIIFAGSGFAQEPESPIKYHSLTYTIGSNWLQEDDLFPIVHKGPVNGLTYRFEKSDKNYNEFAVSLRYSKIKAKLETERVSQNIQIAFDYCMGFHLVNREKLNYYLGYNVKYSNSLVEFPVWDESRAYWASSLTSGITNRLFINTKTDQCWLFILDFNPVGFYSRPDEIRIYAQEDWSLPSILKTTNSNFKPGFVNNVLLCNFRSEYRFLARKNHYLAVQYSFSFTRICRTNEQPHLNTTNNLGVSLGF
jgi:hypothetical protein